ncbi:MAG: hypothetical protein K9N47_08320 [Prosthecobacter sp.]|uniref:hypothetical protein n=1 Tax=Prosthecobacter sp. TaxID=1965333 RepID=UPI0025EC4389|nr:hypothetical protein [Prosthecobacter sp.]MCF7786113.1 hypothetical protein [Prosthecobacter sp.]
MKRASTRSRDALLACAFALLASDLPEQAMAASTKDYGDIVSWIDAGTDEVGALASPLPQLLFSLPPSRIRTSSLHLSWLSDTELHPFQECVNPDARLIDLTNQVEVLDPAFWELVSTDGLIIDITARPKDPIPGGHVIYSPLFNDKPRWEAFWKNSLPVPSSLRSMAFTRELLQEDDKLSRSAARRFCRSSWNCLCISHEDDI